MRIRTAEEMRRLDQHTIEKIGLPGTILMESAGRSTIGVISRIEQGVSGKRAAIFCGLGNNGGDGLVVARYLTLAGAQVSVFLFEGREPKTADAQLHFKALSEISVSIRFITKESELKSIEGEAEGWDFAVDALFGTGLSRPVDGLFRAAIIFLNSWKKKQDHRIYAIDIPSGLHADNGKVLGKAIRASHTVTFDSKKLGFFLGEGPNCCGEVHTADISLVEPKEMAQSESTVLETEEKEVRSWFKRRRHDSHKGTHGHVLLVAGSPSKSGASVLASTAVLRAGAGLATLATPKSSHTITKSQLLEVMSEPLEDDGKGQLGPELADKLLKLVQGKQALAVGPGLAPHPQLKELLSEFLSQVEVPTVLDADGLNAFGQDLKSLGPALGQMVLTPHPGEMARLTGETTQAIAADRLGTARRLACKTGAVVVLKGAHSVIAQADGKAYLNPTGNCGMATAGMGDILTGIIASFMAQGLSPYRAAVAGVFMHGRAGDRVAARMGQRGLLASDLLDELPRLSL